MNTTPVHPSPAQHQAKYCWQATATSASATAERCSVLLGLYSKSHYTPFSGSQCFFATCLKEMEATCLTDMSTAGSPATLSRFGTWPVDSSCCGRQCAMSNQFQGNGESASERREEAPAADLLEHSLCLLSLVLVGAQAALKDCAELLDIHSPSPG